MLMGIEANTGAFSAASDFPQQHLPSVDPRINIRSRAANRQRHHEHKLFSLNHLPPISVTLCGLRGLDQSRNVNRSNRPYSPRGPEKKR